MSTIQIVIDDRLLKAANVEAKRQKVNRSALIRSVLSEHFERRRIAELEEQEQRAYEAQPQREDEMREWLEIAAWPEN